MKKLGLGVCLALGACASADEQLLAKNGIPGSVVEALPDGVTSSAVGLEGGCYLYDGPDGSVVFVTDENGDRICVK
ncbi:MAG: hypothetical protein AAF340_01140 [Pseudomonadota bacterium]